MNQTNNGITLTGHQTKDYRILALYRALKIETHGLRRGGRSAYSIIKEEFGFKGNKTRVLTQLHEWIVDNIMEDHKP